MRRLKLWIPFLMALTGDSGCSEDTVTKEVVPDCGPTQPQGACDAGKTCFEGSCVDSAGLCSPTNVDGMCPSGTACFAGGCVLQSALCNEDNPSGPCEVGNTCLKGDCVPTGSLCSATRPDGVCPGQQVCQDGVCSGEDEPPCDAFVYEEQPAIDAHTSATGKEVLEVDGLQFKDLNANGDLDLYEDWRLPEICRARDLVARMNMDQKIGVMSESSYFGSGTDDGILPDSVQEAIVDRHIRYALIRVGPVAAPELAVYLDNVQELCESQPLGIPATVTADPLHGFGMSTDPATGDQSLNASSVVSPFPYPLGLGAINDPALTRSFADLVREEFMAMGLRWQLGPMADLATEPRWARVQNTLGSNAIQVPYHVHEIVSGFQAAGEGGLKNGIASTIKHFPGAGPNEDGMDSHSYVGRFNVFPGQNFEAHQRPFQAAIDAGVAALMPCYSVFKGQTDYDRYQVGAAYSHDLITVYLKRKMGFTGMVTADWASLESGFNTEVLSLAQRAAMFLQAGSHQLGLDSPEIFHDAYELGYVTEAQIDEAAVKIFEMSFKLGLFENPYVDPEATPVRSMQNRLAGFNAQKRAIVMLRNRAHEAPPAPTGFGAPPDTATRYLPIDGSRYADENDSGEADSGEYICDTDGDGVVEVYFDGVYDSLVSSPDFPDVVTDVLGEYDYTSEGGDDALPIAEASSLQDADIAVLRITARKGVYFGLDAGVPLSFDGPFPGTDEDPTLGAAVADRNRVLDAFRVRDGYRDAAGAAVAAANPDLRIILVMHMDRPGIVEPFIAGMSTLDEVRGQPGSYPLVSDAGNHDPAGLSGVDGFLVEFGAYDRALLDFLFNVNPIDDWEYGQAVLPMELPSSDEAVELQYEDLAADSLNPTFVVGSGQTY